MASSRKKNALERKNPVAVHQTTRPDDRQSSGGFSRDVVRYLLVQNKNQYYIAQVERNKLGIELQFFLCQYAPTQYKEL